VTGPARQATSRLAIETPPPPLILTLAPECLVSEAICLKEGLAGLLDEPLSVTLDVTALHRIDTAGLQVLAAFVRDRAGRGLEVQWRGTAPALSGAAQLLGLTSLLGLPA
jgi:phospholipid transport system transporter-binding protein